MTLFILGLVLFLIPHMVSVVNHSWRDRMVGQLGEWTWKGLYSVVAAVGLTLIIIGYGDARPGSAFLYSPPLWMNHLVALLMLPVFILLLAAYLPGRIQSHTKHPMLIATKLWALSHLLANGRVVEVLLFGSLLIWAVMVRISLKRRPTRSIPNLPKSGLNDVIAVVAGLGLYVLFAFHLHLAWIGVPPIASS